MDSAFTTQIAEHLRRLQAYEHERIHNALAILPPRARQVINELALLLHCNHPLIPGYRRDGVPHGIDGFQASLAEQQALLRRSGAGVLPQPQTGRCDILALYAMGSTASIGQGAHSDFDIWVCVSKDLEPHALRQLDNKCRFLEVVARSRGVDLSLFVTPENRFQQGRHGDLGHDNCGSAQNLFLLDEFYRTCVHLAGRHLLWHLVPTAAEQQDYETYIQRILALPFIDPQQWFDLGSVLQSSPAEYFGSGLWLLYKGIDAPFKAAIKILLMEVYANSYPSTRLLSSELKDRLLAGEKDPLRLDPYCAMFQRVTEYLALSHDEQRLDLMRKCFYFKIFYGIQGLPCPEVSAYRRRLLQHYAAAFGWSGSEVRRAEYRERWKVHVVRALNRKLLHSLSESYRSLLLFSIRHGIEHAITSDDVGRLSRRLYIAYDRYPGKILLFGPELNTFLGERNLTFIYPRRDSLCRQEWHIFPCAKDDIALLSMPVGYVGKSIIEVIAWACFNHLLQPDTHIDVAGVSGLVTGARIHLLAHDLMRLLHPNLRPGSVLTVQRPLEIRRCMIILNFEADPTRNTRQIGDFDTGNSLSWGRQRRCLIGSIELIMITSWDELVAVSLANGEEGTVDLLAMLVKMGEHRPGADPMRCIDICSYAANCSDLLRFDLKALIKKVFMHQARHQDFTFGIGHNNYLAHSTNDRGIIITRRNAFGRGDYDISIFSRFGMRPEFSLQVPSPIDRYATIGVIQYFFAPAEQGWDIYVLNERNEVQIMPGFLGSRQDLVNAINRFYTRQNDTRSGYAFHFNLPQYFELSADRQSIIPFTIGVQPPQTRPAQTAQQSAGGLRSRHAAAQQYLP